MKFCTDIHVPLRMNCNDVGDILTFQLPIAIYFMDLDVFCKAYLFISYLYIVISFLFV